ncbi:MAG: Gfo/Idh/MocA family oxidoreductase [Gammaproteobacteria bacterium]|nr:Gfo/Idh/MocA family oxidoreductase [Gammaproteobacteria bacterium]
MIRIGILGAARITPRALLYPCMDEPGAAATAVAARNRSRAESFARWANIPKVVDTYDELVSLDTIDAVYNPLPITAHHEWTIKALEAGKHVLCEKSFAANAAEAEEMVAAADRAGRIVMDAFHYRYHPLFLRAREIYETGELGDIEHIEAVFRVPGENIGENDIRKVYDVGGGVTMDIGCYAVSWVRHISGEEPTIISAEAETGAPNVDLMLSADMTFPSGASGKITGDMRDGNRFRAELVVKGSKGEMTVTNPLVPQNGHRLKIVTGSDERTWTFDRRPTYSYQLDAFLHAIDTGEEPLTGGRDAINQMRAIDACYEAAGLPLRGT